MSESEATKVQRLRLVAGNAVLCAIAVFAFLCTIALVRTLAPQPRVPFVSDKLDRWAEIKDQVDVLFVGSSRVFRHLSPAPFAHLLERRAHLEVTPYNLGIPAAHSIEVRSILEEVRRTKPESLRWVIVEPDGLDAWARMTNARTRREVWWHGTRQTTEAIDNVMRTDLSRWSAAQQAAAHTVSWLYHTFAVGMGPDLLEDYFAQRRERARNRPPSEGELNGFVPFAVTPRTSREDRRRDFVAMQAEWPEWVQRKRRAKLHPKKSCLAPAYREELERMVSTIRSLDAMPVFVLSPSIFDRCEIQQAAKEGVIPNLLAFDDPDRYPAFYRPDARFDVDHLLGETAVLYTRAVARAFLRLTDNGRIDGRSETVDGAGSAGVGAADG